MKTLKFEFKGKIYTGRLKIRTYNMNKNLCVQRGALENGCWEPWNNITVNTDTYRESPFAALIDTNNCGEACVRWLLENSLGSLTGRQERSGFCVYPEFLFSEEKLRELDPKGLDAHLKLWNSRQRRVDRGNSVFVIRRKDEYHDRNMNYSTHGAMGGVEDAIGYGRLREARKFLSWEETQAYIDKELPEWARTLHCPVEVSDSELMLFLPELGLLLYRHAEEIPPHLLEPGNGRLLIWRY